MRKPREIVEGSSYHVTARINRGEYLLQDNFEFDLKKMFIEVVHRTHKIYNFRIYDIEVMDNHIHMMIKPEGDTEVGNIIHSILSTFARRYNILFKCHGHVWYDRFKSKVIKNSQQLINTIRYICNNPYRAGMINNPLNYKYSSVYSIYAKIKTELVSLILSIMDLTDKNIRSIYDDYRKEFSFEKASAVNKALGFYPNKPGRPKKIMVCSQL